MSCKKFEVEDASGNKFFLAEVDGVTFPAYFVDDPLKRMQDLKQMKGRDDDIIIAAYPKAGTHWVWEITHMLSQSSSQYHPSPKEEQMMELSSIEVMDNMSSPRVFNTHLRFRQLPKDMISRNCKIIYVQRNPKDMAISRYNHLKSSEATKYPGSWSDFFPLYIQGNVAFGSWFDYTAEWQASIRENKDYPIYNIVYEDLKKDAEGEIEKLANFLGYEASESFVKEIAERCSFESLKTAYNSSKSSKDTEHVDAHAFAFRKGVTGDWKNWFTVAQSETFDKLMEEKLKAKEK